MNLQLLPNLRAVVKEPKPLTGYTPGVMASRPRPRVSLPLPREEPAHPGMLWLDDAGFVQISRGRHCAETEPDVPWAARPENSMQDANAPGRVQHAPMDAGAIEAMRTRSAEMQAAAHRGEPIFTDTAWSPWPAAFVVFAMMGSCAAVCWYAYAHWVR